MPKFGKFEGEPFWVELLWDRALSGFSDMNVWDGTNAIDGFRLDAEIAALTGYDVDHGRYVCLWENDQGFVSHTTLSYQELIDCEGFELDTPTEDFTPGVDPDFDEMGGES